VDSILELSQDTSAHIRSESESRCGLKRKETPRESLTSAKPGLSGKSWIDQCSRTPVRTIIASGLRHVPDGWGDRRRGPHVERCEQVQTRVQISSQSTGPCTCPDGVPVGDWTTIQKPNRFPIGIGIGTNIGV